jgi:hypothetical protein
MFEPSRGGQVRLAAPWIRRGKDTAILFSPARESGERIIPRRGLRGSRRPDGFTLTHGALTGTRTLLRRRSASRKTISITQGKPFSNRRTVADERPKRARQQRQLQKLKTLFPLDLVAGFAQRRLTGTNN